MTATAAKASTKKTKTVKAKAKAVKPKAATAAKAKTTAAAKPKAVQAPKIQSIDKQKSGLRAWNLRLGIVLVVLAAAVVIVGDSASAPLTTQYLAKDALASDAAGKDVLATASRHLWDVPVAWMVAKFLLIFGAVYLLSATLLRKQYEAWLERGVNGWRWLALGVGGGSVMTTVAMISGVSSLTTLSLIFGSTALAGLLAAAVEFIGTGRRLRRLLAFGALAAVFLPWLTFVRNVAGVPLYNGSLPLYMYFLYAAVTLLVVTVVLATYMRIKQRGRWADTLYTEKMFMILGFLVAVVPALQIFAGVLQP